jgi:hypothetical protein
MPGGAYCQKKTGEDVKISVIEILNTIFIYGKKLGNFM